MATLGGIYLFIESEQGSFEVDAVTHPVESGCDITAHVKQSPVVLSLQGKIVGADAQSNREAIIKSMNNGSLLKYSGRNVLSNMQIRSFGTTHSKDVWGGFDFTMELQQVRIAKTAYVATSASQTQTTSKSPANASADPKAGDKIKLSNEALYVSSDAKNPANHVSGTYYVYDGKVILGRIRITNTASRVGKTPIGKNVTGWIDAKARGTSTAGTVNAGQQQITENSTASKVYHTVKSGDTVWSLVAASNAPYKKYGFSCADVMEKNPDAFSRYGDFGTLQNGAKLWVGNR